MRYGMTAFAAVSVTAVALAFPVVSSDGNNVQLNVWNSDFAAGKAKAKALNRPLLAVMGDSVTCSLTKGFDSKVLSTTAFTTYLSSHPMVLIMVDRSQLTSSKWQANTTGYREPNGSLLFPTVVVLHPNGTLADRFLGRSTLGSDPGFYDRLQQTLDLYPDSGGGGTEGSAPAFVTPTPGSGTTLSVEQNAPLTLQISATSATPVSYSASGLPAGLSINAATGAISGTPTALGAATVTVTVSNSSGSVSTSFTLSVVVGSADPAGSYQGVLLDGEEQAVRGKLSLTVASSGSLSAQAELDGKTYTFKGALLSGAAEITLSSGLTLNVQVDAAGNLSGSVGDTALLGRRIATSGLAPFTGYYTALLNVGDAVALDEGVDNRPQGSGYVTFSVSSSGSVKYAGKLGDGVSLSGSSKLMVYDGAELADLGFFGTVAGQTYAGFPVYKTLYSGRGSVAALVWIDGAESSAQTDNQVLLFGSSWVYPGKSATFTADGFTATLDDGSLSPVGAAFVKPENLAAVFDGGSFEVDGGSAAVVASNASIKLESGNELSASMSASTTTGVISGQFLFDPESGAAPFKVRYTGILVPGLGVGGGFYLQPETLDSGVKIQRSQAVAVLP